MATVQRASRTPAEFGAADDGLRDVLASLEQSKNYTAWIRDLIAPHVTGRIFEVGAGRGTYSPFFAERGHLTALEPSAVHCAQLRERLASYPNAVVVNAPPDGTAAPGSYDTVVLINVLEHLPDDHRALGELYEALAPGGKMVLWVPAFEALYGSFDHSIGHYRRYRKRQLLEQVQNVGFHQVTAHYANLPGFFAWWVVVRVLRRTPTGGRLARTYDRFFVPVVRRIERIVRPPFGQSLLVVVQRA
ncbi:MAG TPA: class I SAM-dependent methyltransferase [Ilumatobacteraceae bacterium]|nr:class I SAM-dependent methyltransferase [Ilumatobacteraceae bacterium]